MYTDCVRTQYSVCYVCVWQAKKIMEHKRKYERQREERELQKRKEKIRKAREAYEKQKQVWTPPKGCCSTLQQVIIIIKEVFIVPICYTRWECRVLYK